MTRATTLQKDAAMVLAGAFWTDAKIAALFGKHVTAIGQWRRERGVESGQTQALAYRRRLYDEGLSDGEIGRRTGVPSKHIQMWRAHNGLSANVIVEKCKTQGAMALYEAGLLDPEMAARLGTSAKSIARWRTRRGLKSNWVLSRRPKTKPRPLPPPISPMTDDLYRRAADAIGRGLAPDIQADAVSDLILAMLEGSVPADRIAAEARRIRNKAVEQWASRFGSLSIDEQRGEDGFTIGDLVPDPAALAAFDGALERGLARAHG